MDDETLVREAVGGSVPAFTAIFDQHVAQVHDLALAMLRERRAAFSTVQATFREASERLETLKEPHRLLVWLLAITRFHGARAAGERAGPDRLPTRLGDGADRPELVAQVWEATADLPLRERALLDLHLRHGLDGEDLADALGVSPAEGIELQQGMGGIERGLAGYLVTRQTDRRCPDLPLVLRGWDGHFTPLVSTHVAAHVDACRVCRETSAELPSPFALYASVPQAPLPGEEPAPSPPPPPDEPPTQIWPGRPTEATPPASEASQSVQP